MGRTGYTISPGLVEKFPKFGGYSAFLPPTTGERRGIPPPLSPVCVIVYPLDLRRQVIREHTLQAVLISILYGLFIVPAFEFQHIQHALQVFDLGLHRFFCCSNSALRWG